MSDRDEARLTLGQRLMLGLVIAPGSLLLALGTWSDLLSPNVLEWSLLEHVVTWIYLLFLVWVGAWTMTMAVTGRAPEGLQ